MMLYEYLLIGVGIVILVLIYYIFSRDSQQHRQIRAIATAVEHLNHQVYELQQRVNASLKEMEVKEGGFINDADLRYELEVGISEYTKPMQTELHKFQDELSHTTQQMQKRLMQIEESLRAFSLPASVNGMDDERIITLFKQGIDIETISKELRLSKPEVEFVLKINKLR